MLKLFYKSVVISVLSGCLMLMNFTYKTGEIKFFIMDTVQAETLKTEGISDNNLMATLTMTSVGLLTSRLWSCKLTPDMLVAAAAGAAFIGGEVIATLKLKKIMEDLEMEIQRDIKGDINKEQIEALVRLRKSYEGAKTIANVKKMLQGAAAAAFLVAGGVAFGMDKAEKLAFANCKAAAQSPGNTCIGLAPTATGSVAALLNLETGRWVVGRPSAAGIAMEKAASGVKEGALNAEKAQAQALAASYQATCNLPGGGWACVPAQACRMAPTPITAACTPITPLLSKTSGFCPASLAISASGQPDPSFDKYKYAFTPMNPVLFLSKMLSDYFLTSAHASLFSPLGIASSAAVGFLIATSKTLGPTIDTYLLAPMNRAIIWGVLGALVFAATTATNNVIAKIESNIKKIDDILNAMHLLSDGTAAAVVTDLSIKADDIKNPIKNNLNIEDVKYDDIHLSNQAGGVLPCYTGGDSTNCKSFEAVSKNIDGFATLDAETQKQIDGILKKANAFNGASTISAGTIKGMGQLAGSANALRSKYDKLKSDAAKRLKASGSKFDLNKTANKFSDSLAKGVLDSLKNSNSTPENMMASIYGGSSAFGLGDKNKNANNNEEKKKAEGVNSVFGGSEEMARMNSGISSGDDDHKDGSEETLAALGTSEDGAKKINVDDYEIKNDITKDSEPSIFELISNRYRSSAYPRLFKVKDSSVQVKEIQ